MEKISKKRGRPLKMEKGEVDEALWINSGITTRRGLMNVHYSGIAIDALGDDPAFNWLRDYGKINGEYTTRKRYRGTILAELGRFADADAIVLAASRICQLKPKTKQAVAILRGWRTGSLPRGTKCELANRIIDAINEYLTSHAPMDWGDVVDAASLAAEQAAQGPD